MTSCEWKLTRLQGNGKLCVTATSTLFAVIQALSSDA